MILPILEPAISQKRLRDLLASFFSRMSLHELGPRARDDRHVRGRVPQRHHRLSLHAGQYRELERTCEQAHVASMKTQTSTHSVGAHANKDA